MVRSWSGLFLLLLCSAFALVFSTSCLVQCSCSGLLRVWSVYFYFALLLLWSAPGLVWSAFALLCSAPALVWSASGLLVRVAHCLVWFNLPRFLVCSALLQCSLLYSALLLICCALLCSSRFPFGSSLHLFCCVLICSALRLCPSLPCLLLLCYDVPYSVCLPYSRAGMFPGKPAAGFHFREWFLIQICLARKHKGTNHKIGQFQIKW